MGKVKLSKRLQTVADLVSQKRVCDIACDHGKVIAKLFEDNKIDYAIVSDISEKCAIKAKELLLGLGFANFQMRVGDGFESIYKDDEIQQVIISGLGGLEIIKILQNSDIQPNSLIIQPQNHAVELKKYIINNGYNIVYDKIIYDEKYYNIFKVEKGVWRGVEFDLYFGKNNFINNADFSGYLIYLSEKINKFIGKLSGGKLDEYKKIMQFIKIAKNKIGD